MSAKSDSECLIFRPVVPHVQTVAATGAEDGYHNHQHHHHHQEDVLLAETRHDRSDNVTSNWTQVNPSDVNAVII